MKLELHENCREREPTGEHSVGSARHSAGACRILKGAILVGGASRRMGRDKAALEFQGRSLLDTAIDLLRPFVQTIAVVGRLYNDVGVNVGDRCDALGLVRLKDDSEVSGPLAGVAAALAHDSNSCWLFLPCDMPGMTRQALQWLLDQHDVRHSATIGFLLGNERVEPFPAVYSPSANEPLRAFVRSGSTSLRGGLTSIKAIAAPIPVRFTRCWRNVNTPVEWKDFLRNHYRGKERSNEE